ncbi:unnamed protein product [Vitrella brassicaformis CCMP3155]|uniref:Uncharacterized protein n=1 Tax=Vitrella brassicaformis (strain CCMP3155) TaxID=1169540 RepID=A0A0G4FIF1_VITBC|nr:unnamed protein product [Vitrella brassicaformis CCMP3155]|eukprot:CEM13221.1 unnamed protein product [Vitrella brassicaformis CCMP3155]
MQQQQHQQQHPFSYIFVGRRAFYLLSLTDVLQLRATCTWLSKLFGAAQLRDRLRHSLGSQAGLRRVVNGRQVQLMRFDDEQFGAYLSVSRVLAQLMVVGRHVRFGVYGSHLWIFRHANGNGSCLRIFRRANGEVRALEVQPGFRLDVNPPLPARHLYQQHRLEHDPPVRSGISYFPDIDQWVSINLFQYASASSFAKHTILDHFSSETQQINSTSIDLNRRVGGGRLDGLLTDSPHTPVAGCTTTLTWEGPTRDLVLTDSSQNFVAWIKIRDMVDGTARVQVWTIEAPVGGEGRAFKDRFPVTTQLARVALERAAPYVFDGQVPTMAAMRAVQVALSD